jgi:hypothetical protein
VRTLAQDWSRRCRDSVSSHLQPQSNVSSARKAIVSVGWKAQLVILKSYSALQLTREGHIIPGGKRSLIVGL